MDNDFFDNFLNKDNNFDKCLETMKKINDSKNKRIKFLENQVNELKDKQSKDKEIQKMKKYVEKAQRELRQGFPISDEQNKQISDWMSKHIREKHWDKKHNCESYCGAAGGRFIYQFLPTGIGTFITVKCSCGEKFEIEDL